MKKLAITIALISLLGGMGMTLTGCTSMPPIPDTPYQHLYYAYGTLEGLATTTQTLYQSGTITAKEAGDMARMLDEAYESLQRAEGFFKASLDGQDDLDIAISLLGHIRNFLIERSKAQ